MGKAWSPPATTNPEPDLPPAARRRQSYRLDQEQRIYDEAGNVIETHDHKGEFKEW